MCVESVELALKAICVHKSAVIPTGVVRVPLVPWVSVSFADPQGSLTDAVTNMHFCTFCSW